MLQIDLMKHIISLTLVFAILLFACKPEVEQAKLTGDAALDDLNAQVQSDPENAELRVQRADLLYQKNSFDEAITDLQVAISIDSTKAQYFHKLSDVFMDYYQSRAALNIMEQAGERFPERIPTLLKLSETQVILKEYSESIQTVNNILALEPQNPDAFFMLGVTLTEQGDTTRAINAFQTAVENNPELIDAWLYIGGIYENQKDKRALDYYNAAISANPNSIEALHSKAFYLQNHDDIAGAIDIYNQINTIDPRYQPSFLNKGILYLELDSLDRAKGEFDILCGINPKDALGFYYRGVTQQLQGNVEAARQDFQNAINLNPDFERARRALSDLPAQE